MKQKCKNPGPIFILGIMYRSGTNFLHDLVCLHPDCVDGGFIKEDFLLSYSHLLVDYANFVYSRWNTRWQVREKIGPPEVLVKCIGDSLLHYLNLQLEVDGGGNCGFKRQQYIEESKKCGVHHRLVTKTPSVENLHNFYKLFPGAKLILIVRDGRAIVESGVRSFNWNYEKATHNWKRMAKVILSFKNKAKKTHDFLLIRYEDLFTHTDTEIRKILSFAELDESKYDFETACNLPIKGSSDVRKNQTQQIHWNPVEKPIDFDPLSRFKNWGFLRHARFNWIAGQELESFGYAKVLSNHSLGLFYNLAKDFQWRFITLKTLLDALISRGKRYLQK